MSEHSERRNSCPHPGDRVWADILVGAMVPGGGESGGQQVQWCSHCGAFRPVFGNPHALDDLRYGDWTAPSSACDVVGCGRRAAPGQRWVMDLPSGRTVAVFLCRWHRIESRVVGALGGDLLKIHTESHQRGDAS